MNLGRPTSPAPSWAPRHLRLRAVVNGVTLATPLGLLLAKAGRATVVPGPHGLLLATGFRPPLRVCAPAFAVGDVVLLRRSGRELDQLLTRRPRLLDHEARHAAQWACWLGPAGFVPAYLLACAWSYWQGGNPATRNPFEIRAGLTDGGYGT